MQTIYTSRTNVDNTRLARPRSGLSRALLFEIFYTLALESLARFELCVDSRKKQNEKIKNEHKRVCDDVRDRFENEKVTVPRYRARRPYDRY